jgi:hypothetical protein
MTKIKVSAERVIPDSAEKIYRVLVDYEVGHPAIMPEKYFSKLVVVAGGRGAGT